MLTDMEKCLWQPNGNLYCYSNNITLEQYNNFISTDFIINKHLQIQHIHNNIKGYDKYNKEYTQWEIVSYEYSVLGAPKIYRNI